MTSVAEDIAAFVHTGQNPFRRDAALERFEKMLDEAVEEAIERGLPPGKFLEAARESWLRVLEERKEAAAWQWQSVLSKKERPTTKPPAFSAPYGQDAAKPPAEKPDEVLLDKAPSKDQRSTVFLIHLTKHVMPGYAVRQSRGVIGVASEFYEEESAARARFKELTAEPTP